MHKRLGQYRCPVIAVIACSLRPYQVVGGESHLSSLRLQAELRATEGLGRRCYSDQEKVHETRRSLRAQ